MGGSLSPLFTPDNSGDKTSRKRNLLETIKGARKTRAPSTTPRELDKKQKTKNPYAYDDAPYQRFRLDGNGDNSSSCNKGNCRRPEARIEHPWCKQVVRNKGSECRWRDEGKRLGKPSWKIPSAQGEYGNNAANEDGSRAGNADKRKRQDRS